MAIIEVLDQHTINQIAAGEVIERPASVVKELLENAIDAKATSITVEIKEGGISFIRITDNGCGIDKEDIPLAFLRHSTSKIKNAVDLLTVSSLGFRGEALSSIAAVGMVELITKTPSAVCGHRYVIEGGNEKSFEEIGVPLGTTFIVRNLFYNTPARRKFLKSAATEGGYISDIVEKIALSHPKISIRLIVNNQNKLHTSGNGSLKEVIYSVYNREIANNIIEIKGECPFMKIYGFIGKPVLSRGNRTYENYFINGRFIKSSFISKAIEDAYKPYLMQHRYPFTCIYLEVNQELLDVNVHPTKMELRFRNQDEIYPFVYESISNGLKHKELILETNFDTTTKKDVEEKQIVINGLTKNVTKESANETIAKKQVIERLPEPFEVNRTAQMLKETSANYSAEITQKTKINEIKTDENKINENKINETKVGEIRIQEIKPLINEKNENNEEKTREEVDLEVKNKAESIDVENEKIQETKPIQLELFDNVLLSEKAKKSHKIVGQLFDTYWIVEFDGKMYIIDQHAAHEKVLYERLMARYNEKNNMSQELNPPILISLSMREEEILLKNIDMFNEMGYEIESFGGGEYALRAVPYDLLNLSSKDIILEIIDELTENDSSSASRNTILDKIASMSCKAAVKGNSSLSDSEAKKLIDELMTLENPYNCPHGRPTIISMTKYELEKKFKRIV